jgi:ribosomal 50S subunit-recycling heat shock protein
MEYFLRIDKFLNAVNLTKRRAIAQDMISEDVVLLNGKAVKPAKNVAIGDIITLVYLSHEQRFEVLMLPTIKSTPKSQQHLYVKELV